MDNARSLTKLERALGSTTSLQRVLREGKPELFVEAILMSAKLGYVETLSWLLAHNLEGQDEEHIARDVEERTVLHWAAQNDNIEILELYLSYCA